MNPKKKIRVIIQISNETQRLFHKRFKRQNELNNTSVCDGFCVKCKPCMTLVDLKEN